MELELSRAHMYSMRTAWTIAVEESISVGAVLRLDEPYLFWARAYTVETATWLYWVWSIGMAEWFVTLVATAKC